MNKVSIVIPIFNEKDNLFELYNEINETLRNQVIYEIIFVNDGSIDKSEEVLQILSKYKEVKIIKHEKNYGQSKAIYTGIKLSNFDNIVTLDGDRQNDPKDINNLLKIFFSNNYSLVSGIRYKRKDSLIKVISSKLANNLRSFILKDNCQDTGCSLKVFSKNIFLEFPYFNGMHRFLPALFVGFGYKTFYVNVNHRPRIKGKSNYGTFGRLFKGIIDIIRVLIIINKNK